MPLKNTREVPAGGAQPPGGTTAPTGPEVIAEDLKTLPNAPGVYRMIDAAGDVLYVGKARSLKKRVTNYAQGRLPHQPHRAAWSRDDRVDGVRDDPHRDRGAAARSQSDQALAPALQRAAARRQVVPLHPDRRDHAVAQILKHRGARTRKGDYFGPFASAGAVNRTINSLQRAFLLRTCSDCVFESRTRPCLLYQIKRCSAPCTGEIGARGLCRAGRRGDATSCRGKSQKVQARCIGARCRTPPTTSISSAPPSTATASAALSHVTADQGINPQTVDEADVFAIHQEGGQTCIQVFFFRDRPELGQPRLLPARRSGARGRAKCSSAFLAQFYDDKPIPRMILLSPRAAEQDLLAEALSTKAGRKVEIRVPQRGEKNDLVDTRPAERPRGAGPAAGRDLDAGRLLDGVAETVRAAERAAPHRGLRQLATSWAPTRSAP